MKNIFKRLLLFTVALPLLTLLMFFAPHFHFAWIMVFLIFIGLKCGLEVHAILRNMGESLPIWTIAFPAVSPLLSWLTIRGSIPLTYTYLALALVITWAFTGMVFASEEKIALGFQNIAARLIIALYPGFFLWWIQAIAGLPQYRYAPLIFMLAIYLNDSAAWCIGMLAGKHRGIVPVSPNKSLEGFMAGIFATTVVIITSSYILPDFFPHPRWQIFLFGILLGVVAILGDLVESSLKRVANIKDSGKFILGRGGMLDSIDSMFFAAPFFVLFLQIGTTPHV